MDSVTTIRQQWWEHPIAWTLVAALSLAAGSLGALQPGRSADLTELLSWLRVWDFGAVNPFVVAGLRVDYPPHTFVMLGPLVWLPPTAAPAMYAALNVLLTALAAWTTVMVVVEGTETRLTPSQRTVLVMMSLACGVFRSALWLGQTMPLAWWLLMVAVRECRRRPMVAGVALGLGLFKLNLALAVVLALVSLRRVRTLVWGGITVAVLTLVFAMMTQVSLPELALQYVRTLGAMYGAQGYVPDWLSLRGLVTDPRWTPAVQVYLATTFLWVAWVTWRWPLRSIDVLSMWLLWVLQAVAHQRFNLVMALPAVLLLAPAVRAGGHPWAFLAATVFLVGDVPWLLRQVDGPVLSGLAALAPRVFVLALWGSLVLRIGAGHGRSTASV